MRAQDGKVVWQYNRKAHPWIIFFNGLVVDEKKTVVYSGVGKDAVALDVSSGRVIWSGAGWDGPREACVDTAGIGEGRIVSSGNWLGMYCNDAKSGKLLWSVIDDTRRFPGATPLIKDGRIYTLAAKSYLEIDLESGKTLREKKFPFSVQVATRVLQTDRHLIFGTVKSGLVALDRKTLEVAWRGAVGPAIAPYSAYSKKPQRCVGTRPFLLPDGVLCASSNDGAIHFWREADGKHLKELRTGAPYFADVTVKGDKIFAADAQGYVRMFALT
jgi:outer membrane protein assembly factor BamB